MDNPLLPCDTTICARTQDLIAPVVVFIQTLMPLQSGEDFFWDEKPLDVPKELWMMVDHLYHNACQKVSIYLSLCILIVIEVSCCSRQVFNSEVKDRKTILGMFL